MSFLGFVFWGNYFLGGFGMEKTAGMVHSILNFLCLNTPFNRMYQCAKTLMGTGYST